MSMLIPYDASDFKSPGTGFHHDGLWLRPGIVQSINVETGLVTLEWLDYPGVRTEVSVSQPTHGIFEMPPAGAVVLVAFDQGFKAQIVRHLPVGYARQRVDGDIPQLHPGAKVLMSYVAESQVTGEFPIPVWTGTLIHMNNTGDIELATASGERWFMDNNHNAIDQSSMNYKVQTEAGILEFGLTKRVLGDDDIEATIIDTDGVAFPHSLSSDPDALTEFRLRVLDKADANFDTAPEVDDPFIELTLGVKVGNDGRIVETNNAHFEANKEIIIQLKTKTGQGFEFTVDRDGNLTLKTGANIKIDATGDMEVNVGGNADIITQGNVNVDAANVRLVGDKAVVLENFISKFNTHTHKSASPGIDTAPPSFPISKSSVVSKKVKVE